MWNSSNKFQHFKMYETKQSTRASYQNKYVAYQTLLKRCENVMAKHIFQYTIKPSENILNIYV